MDNLFEKEPKKIKKPKKSYLILGLVVVLILFGFWILAQVYIPCHPEDEKEIIFNVEKEEGLADISSNLKKTGLIKSKILFKLAAISKGVQGKLQAGAYFLSSSMSTSEILDKISSGEIAKEKITIIEGWTLKDIGWYFEEIGLVNSSDEFFEIVGYDSPNPRDFSQNFEFLKEKAENVSLEGYLFPDTYEIKKGEGLESVVKKMLENFDNKFTETLQEEIKKQDRTLYQVLTMASLLEKEVKSYTERQIAAGILWKRLRNWWPLQVDATLTYLTGKGSDELTKEDLEIDSPYNTYKYYGLPIGPICNPGIESIKAAIYYKESDFWFYLTTADGKTEFSKTLEEHNVKRFNYLK